MARVKNKAPNINHQWKKFMAVGCSHGHLADPRALARVLEFAEDYKPETRIHLGDYTDMAAFRKGAAGTHDETAPIGDDLRHGLGFLEAYRPTILINGNHEIRLWEQASHHNQIIAEAAGSVIAKIQALVDKLDCKFVEHYDVTRSWVTLGDTKFLHGWWFNVSAIRDHAEHFGNVVLAHLHRVGSEPARRSDGARGYCVGTLANVPSMTYALKRRATAAWSHGIAYGEYSDTHCHVNLSECKAGDALNWRLPS